MLQLFLSLLVYALQNGPKKYMISAMIEMTYLNKLMKKIFPYCKIKSRLQIKQC